MRDGERSRPGRRWAAAIVVLAFGCEGKISTPLGPGSGGGDRADLAPPDAPSPGGRDVEGEPPDPLAPGSGRCAPPPRRLWPLTPVQIEATLQRAVSGFAGAGEALQATFAPTSGFSSTPDRQAMTGPHLQALFRLADDVARHVVSNPAAQAACFEGGPITRACVETYLARLAQAAFRQPLAAEVLRRYVHLFDEEAELHGAASGLRQAVRAVVLSPHFLFRPELGQAADTSYVLTSYERASAIAYLLTDAPPDATLLAAAAAGELDGPDGVETEIRRLLADEPAGLVRMLEEHFETRYVHAVVKDPAVFELSDDLSSALQAETRALIAQAVDGGRSLETLLTSTESFVNERLAELYGIEGVTGEALRRVELPAERRGLLTTPGVMAVHAHDNGTDPVHRGKFILQKLLCIPVPPPPPEVGDVPPLAEEAISKRDQLAFNSEDPKCATCHRLLDPVGLAFESFDLVGRFRTEDAAGPIDTEDAVELGAMGMLAFESGADLANELAAFRPTYDCVADALFEYVVGRAPGPEDACRIDAFRDAFWESGGDLEDAVVELLVDSQSFVRE